MSEPAAESQSRRLLFCVDASDASEEAIKWAMDNVFKAGDEVHIVHVIPRFQFSSSYGAPAVDFLPLQDKDAYESMIKGAETFIARRVLRHMGAASSPTPIIHLVKFETDSDSIGHVICRKADELKVAVVVVARHDKSKLKSFFLGSVSEFCVQHCHRPLLVHHHE